MSIIGKNEHSNNSYSNWLPSRQMLSKANIVLIGIVSATLLGLSYVWYTNTEDSSHAPQQNLCATTALSTVASGGLQTAATLAIPVFQGMSFLGRLAVGAHLDRQQERRNLFGAGEIDETWIEEILENEPTDLAPKIIHIPQIHTIPGIENSIPGLFAVWESQIRVLEQLLLYPNGAVFDEGVAETIQHRNSEFAEEVNRVFPDGLPKNRESWDEIQMRFLIYFGAARTLHHLGKIETIHRSIDPKTGEEIDAIIGAARSSGLSFCDEPIRELAFDRREEALAKEVREFLKNPENQGRPILIVFGRGHDFSDDFKGEDFVRLTNEPGVESKEIASCKKALS